MHFIFGPITTKSSDTAALAADIPHGSYDWYLIGRRDCGDRSAGRCVSFGQTTDKVLGIYQVSTVHDHLGLTDKPTGLSERPVRGLHDRKEDTATKSYRTVADPYNTIRD